MLDGGLDDDHVAVWAKSVRSTRAKSGCGSSATTPAAERGERAGAVAGVRADVEDEVAAADESGIQLSQAALTAGDAVIDCHRAGETEETIEPRH